VKKIGIINRDVSALVAQLGHHDLLVVSDAGFPTPKGVPYIDLSIDEGTPTVAEIIAMIGRELQVESFVFAEESAGSAGDRATEIGAILPDAVPSRIPHAEVLAMAANARGLIRTGECRAFGNVILVTGVTY
jgi:D-ribose pyranase